MHSTDLFKNRLLIQIQHKLISLGASHHSSIQSKLMVWSCIKQVTNWICSSVLTYTLSQNYSLIVINYLPIHSKTINQSVEWVNLCLSSKKQLSCLLNIAISFILVLPMKILPNKAIRHVIYQGDIRFWLH